MTVQTYFHVGIVVSDLDKAMADYSRVLGLTFTEPARVTVPWLADPAPHEHHVHVAFSEDGPPYYELVEASGDGIFSAREQGRILYLGMWEPDMAARITALEASGIGIEAQAQSAENAIPDWIITKPDVLGIRLEYVSTAARAGIERWVHTGIFTGL